jgi:hypothetical protein
MIEESK